MRNALFSRKGSAVILLPHNLLIRNQQNHPQLWSPGCRQRGCVSMIKTQITTLNTATVWVNMRVRKIDSYYKIRYPPSLISLYHIFSIICRFDALTPLRMIKGRRSIFIETYLIWLNRLCTCWDEHLGGNLGQLLTNIVVLLENSWNDWLIPTSLSNTSFESSWIALFDVWILISPTGLTDSITISPIE